MILGKKGSTIVFSIPVSLNGNILSWQEFKFYSPEGDLVDESGKYFNVPGDSVLIERDDEYYREVFIYVIGGVIYVQGFYPLVENVVLPTFDQRGSILLTVKIPPITDPEEISVEINEVIDETN